MGVNRLWPVVAPAEQTISFQGFAVTEGFLRSNSTVHALHVGIDISIWMDNFNAAFRNMPLHASAGENPELKALFYRMCRLRSSPVIAVFVFDGPARPEFKRGKKVVTRPLWMVDAVKELIQHFGFYCHNAPGEAEAELAALNRAGILDAIITDDCDALVFGASCIIRNPQHRLRPDDVALYAQDAVEHHDSVGLTSGGLLLFVLLSGGDYSSGLSGCGPALSYRLARCGLGDELRSIVQENNPRGHQELKVLLAEWRQKLRAELGSNKGGFLKATYPQLANQVDENFPEYDVLTCYMNPVTSFSSTGPGPSSADPGFTVNAWKHQEPKIHKITEFCIRRFGWQAGANLVNKLQALWPGVLCSMLIEPTRLFDPDRDFLATPNMNTTILRVRPKRKLTPAQDYSVSSVHVVMSTDNFNALVGYHADAPNQPAQPIDVDIPRVMVATALTEAVMGRLLAASASRKAAQTPGARELRPSPSIAAGAEEAMDLTEASEPSTSTVADVRELIDLTDTTPEPFGPSTSTAAGAREVVDLTDTTPAPPDVSTHPNMSGRRLSPEVIDLTSD